MTTVACACTCLGCKHFCGGRKPAAGQDAHFARLLLALDRSIAAACRERGVAACDGLDDGQPCEVGTLHTRAAGLAIALAQAIDDPVGASARDNFNRAHDALEAILLALSAATDGREVS